MHKELWENLKKSDLAAALEIIKKDPSLIDDKPDHYQQSRTTVLKIFCRGVEPKVPLIKQLLDITDIFKDEENIKTIYKTANVEVFDKCLEMNPKAMLMNGTAYQYINTRFGEIEIERKKFPGIQSLEQFYVQSVNTLTAIQSRILVHTIDYAIGTKNKTILEKLQIAGANPLIELQKNKSLQKKVENASPEIQNYFKDAENRQNAKESMAALRSTEGKKEELVKENEGKKASIFSKFANAVKGSSEKLVEKGPQPRK